MARITELSELIALAQKTLDPVADAVALSWVEECARLSSDERERWEHSFRTLGAFVTDQLASRALLSDSDIGVALPAAFDRLAEQEAVLVCALADVWQTWIERDADDASWDDTMAGVRAALRPYQPGAAGRLPTPDVPA